MRPRIGSTTEKPLDALVVSELERRRRWLQFPPALEARFEHDRRASRSYHLRVAVMIAAVIYDLFLFCDFHFVRQHFVRCLILRVAVVTPLTIGTYIWLYFNPPTRLRESLTLGMSCVVGFTTLYLWHDVSAAATAFSQTALILLILFVNAMMRLGFRYALASTLFSVADGAIFLHRDHWLGGQEKMTCMCLLVTAVIFTLVANYWMERDERLGYLLRMQVELRGRELSSMNEELLRLSNLDALTGLANRRYFSLGLARAWDEARSAQTPLSLLLIDIDRFKKINDDYGHLYGDEALVRLATSLQEALRSEEGMVARYGGEEFVILLPGVPLEEAMVIAERLRRSARVRGQGTRNGFSLPMTTISIGVASSVPSGQIQPEELLRDADLALYRAKTQGRDRVCSSTRTKEGVLEFSPGSRPVEFRAPELARAK